MARKIFFSFHYERDAWRAGQVRNCNLLPSDDQYGFVDAVAWESIRRQGDQAIKRWINEQLQNTSATVVLIGAQTAVRPWVRYEIVESWKRGNSILGVRIHSIKDQNSQTDSAGLNPFDGFKLLPSGVTLESACKTFDWVAEDGRNNLGSWVEQAIELRAQSSSDEEILDLLENADAAKAGASYGGRATVSAGFAPKAPWRP